MSDRVAPRRILPVPAGPLTSIIGNLAVGDREVRVYFGQPGETFDGITGEGFNAYERARFRVALAQIEAVADIEFRIVYDVDNADFRLVLDTNEMDRDTLGYFEAPGDDPMSGVGVFNGAHFDRQAGGYLERGGDGAVTVVHELLHGLGLMHPHDAGGGSTVMGGVNRAFDDYGRNDLNQGVFTTMSYNSGNQTQQAPWTSAFGSETGPMALDIAALQLIYGAAQNRYSDSVYVLDSRNSTGTGWQAIWDSGGVDTIVHGGGSGATINLRAATLNYERGGGGYVSSVNGIVGGYTIAAGVMIENAKGGNGADRIVGNAGRNVLDGRGGNDVIFGLAGDDLLRGGDLRDTLIGGTGADILLGQQGNDRLQGDLGADRLLGGGGFDTFVFARFDDSKVEAPQRDVIMDFQRGYDRIDLSGIDAHRGLRGDQAFAFVGSKGFDGRDGQGDVRVHGFGNGVVVSVDINGDGYGDMLIEVQHVASLSASDFIF